MAWPFRPALGGPARGQFCALAGPDRVSFAEFIGAIAQAMGVRKPMVRVPMALMRPVAAVLQRLTPNPPATLDELTMLAAGNVGDPRPAAEELGLTLTPLAAAVREAVDQLRAAGRLGG
nr:MAG: hypothetical protein DIU70_12900 [Bacillota bacterium]